MTDVEKTHNFNVLLSDSDYAALVGLAQRHGSSKGAILRSLIRWWSKFDLERDFRCADGSRCLAPHLLLAQRPNYEKRAEG